MLVCWRVCTGLRFDLRASLQMKNQVQWAGPNKNSFVLGGKGKSYMKMCVSLSLAAFQIISESFEKKKVEEKGGVSKKNPTKP